MGCRSDPGFAAKSSRVSRAQYKRLLFSIGLFFVAISFDAHGFKQPSQLFPTVLSVMHLSCSPDAAVIVLTVQAMAVLGNVFGFEPAAQLG